MRVLIYTETFHPRIGGLESRTRLIARHLHDMGVKVSLVTDTEERGNIEFPYAVVRRPSKEELVRLIGESDLVYMNAFHWRLFLWSKLKRKKIAVTYFDLTPICPKGTKWKTDGPCLQQASLSACVPCLKRSNELKVFRRLMRPAWKSIASVFIDANICISPFGMRRYPLWRKRLILNGTDTTLFKPGSPVSESSTPVIVFVGRLIPEKGCQVLLEALRLCLRKGVHFRVLVCGEGPYRSQLESLSQSKGLESRVRFLGMLEGEPLVKVMQTADVAVVPSIIDEPFGNVAIEAMSCGLPVIASNVGGLGPIVSECGLVYERNDASGLADHLERLVTDRSLRESMGRKSRQWAVNRYDYRMMARSYHSLFVSLVGGQPLEFENHSHV